jgi:YHS domain-containing protein
MEVQMTKRTLLRNVLIASAFSAFIAAATMPDAVFANDAAEAERSAVLHLDSAKGNFFASVRMEALKAAKDAEHVKVASTGPASSWFVRAEPNEVNMVTNQHERKAQDEINLNGAVYYGTGDGCARNIRNNPSTRFARDPVTNASIDKSAAVIFADASGRAYYFESEDSFKRFLSLATPETLYGYSEPE